MSNSGLGGFLKSINNATRAVNNATTATNNAKRAGKNMKETFSFGKKNNPQATPTPQPQAQENTWVCSCGATSTNKFCGACGKPAPAEVTCPNCNWVRSIENSNMKFCGNCGTQLPDTN
ncbi:MAG: hypothetical protein FWG79_06735 [Bacteroidales bacterium]|nr:hypothetical protein [Bacteroidales bacterium]